MDREAEGATAGLVACASGCLPSQKPHSALVLDTWKVFRCSCGT